jgi:transcriptional regulator with XRE-family HTH domain
MAITERSEPRATLGDLLRRARLDAGMEQAELAEKIGASRSAIGAWERDRSQPDFGWIKRIIVATNSPWLFTEPFKDDVRKRTASWAELAGQALADVAA